MDKLARHYLDSLKIAAGMGAVGRAAEDLVKAPWTRPQYFGALAGGTVAGGYSLHQTQGQDAQSRIFNAAVNTGVGAMAGSGRAGFIPSISAAALLPTKDLALKGIDTLHHVDAAADSYAKNQGGPATQGILDYLKNNPGHVAAGAGATALGAAGLYALVQGARAAKRIGDGHALRVSTSLRKRPGQSTDLNLGLSPMAAGRLGRGGRTRPGEGEEIPVDEGKEED